MLGRFRERARCGGVDEAAASVAVAGDMVVGVGAAAGEELVVAALPMGPAALRAWVVVSNAMKSIGLHNRFSMGGSLQTDLLAAFASARVGE